MLDAERPRRPVRSSIDRALAELPKRDREALQRALEDWDDDLVQYRVSHRRLAEILTEAGYPTQGSSVSLYRKRLADG